MFIACMVCILVFSHFETISFFSLLRKYRFAQKTLNEARARALIKEYITRKSERNEVKKRKTSVSTVRPPARNLFWKFNFSLFCCEL